MPASFFDPVNHFPQLLFNTPITSGGQAVTGPPSGSAYLVTDCDISCSGSSSNVFTWHYTSATEANIPILNWSPGSTQPSSYHWSGWVLLGHGDTWTMVNGGTSSMYVVMWALQISSPLTL